MWDANTSAWCAGKAASVLFEIAKTDAIQALLQPGMQPVLASTSGVGWGGDEGLTSEEWSQFTTADQDEWVRANCFDCQVFDPQTLQALV